MILQILFRDREFHEQLGVFIRTICFRVFAHSRSMVGAVREQGAQVPQVQVVKRTTKVYAPWRGH